MSSGVNVLRGGGDTTRGDGGGLRRMVVGPVGEPAMTLAGGWQWRRATWEGRGVVQGGDEVEAWGARSREVVHWFH